MQTWISLRISTTFHGSSNVIHSHNAIDALDHAFAPFVGSLEHEKSLNKQHIRMKRANHADKDHEGGEHKKALAYRGKTLCSPYFVEYALSGRSKCCRCKQTIKTNELRVGVMTVKPGKGAVPVFSHAQCFRCPAKLERREQLTTIDSLTTLAEEQIAEMLQRRTKSSHKKRKSNTP